MVPEKDLFEPKDPVDKFVYQCLKDTTDEALIMLGQQGGYIEVENADAKAAMLDPFNSEFLALYQGNLILPYWLYQESTGIDESQMPKLHKSYDFDYSIQWQIENYIEKHLDDCIADFHVFDGQGLKIEKTGNITAEVNIDDSVEVKIDYPIKIFDPDGTIETKNEFFANVPVRLAKIYELAKDIKNYEMNSVFLERNTMNLISIYSRIDNNYLPPMYGGLQFRPCHDYVYWVPLAVKNDMQEMLTANIPYLHIKGTDFEPIVINDNNDEQQKMRQGIYNNMIHNISDKDYPGIKADFSYYHSYPIELGFEDEGLLEPYRHEIDLLFANLCMFEYKFAYNLKYPVLISLTDKESIVDNKEYLFQFPMEVVLKDNFPRVRHSDVFGDEPKQDIKSECDPKQRLSNEISTEVVDINNKGIENVSILFQCGPSVVYGFNSEGSVTNITEFADKCYMGSTKNGTFTSRFPQCTGGGMLTLKADNYLVKKEIIGDTLGKSKHYRFVLDKVFDKKINLQKIYVKPATLQDEPEPGVVINENNEVIACNIGDQPKDLASYENAIIRYKKIDNQNGDLKTPGVALFYPKNESTIKLAEGTYEFEIMLLRNERFNGEMTIKKNSEEKVIKKPFGDETIQYPDEDLMLPAIYTGGSVFTWTVTTEQLEKSDGITFFVFDEGIPKFIEDVGVPLKHKEKCSELNLRRILPKLYNE